MYPFQAVLVGCSNELLNQLQRELAACDARIVFDAPDVRAVQSHVSATGDTRHLLIIHVQRPEQLHDLDRLSDHFPLWPILALMDPTFGPQDLLEAQRQGASQVVALPLRSDDFKQALQRIAKQHGQRQQAHELIVVAGAGEGCGATTVAMNLAYALAEEVGVETILVELALRLGRLANNLDLQPNLTTPSLFSDLQSLDHHALKHSLLRHGPRLMLLPGPYRGIAAPKVEPAQVRELLQQLRLLAPMVVVDVPATFDDVYFAALAAATRLVLVVDHSVPAIQALTVVRDAIERHDITCPQVLVLNRYDRHREDMKASRLEEVVHGPHFHLIPPHYEALRTAMNKGAFVAQVDPHSPLVPAFTSLAQTLAAPSAKTEAPAPHHSALQKLLRWVGY